jgi:hypothetical protein
MTPRIMSRMPLPLDTVEVRMKDEESRTRFVVCSLYKRLSLDGWDSAFFYYFSDGSDTGKIRMSLQYNPDDTDTWTVNNAIPLYTDSNIRIENLEIINSPLRNTIRMGRLCRSCWKRNKGTECFGCRLFWGDHRTKDIVSIFLPGKYYLGIPDPEIWGFSGVDLFPLDALGTGRPEFHLYDQATLLPKVPDSVLIKRLGLWKSRREPYGGNYVDEEPYDYAETCKILGSNRSLNDYYVDYGKL